MFSIRFFLTHDEYSSDFHSVLARTALAQATSGLRAHGPRYFGTDSAEARHLLRPSHVIFVIVAERSSAPENSS